MKRFSVMLVLISALFAGCGGAAKYNSVTISGHVTLDDQPLDSGLIQFAPADGNGSVAAAEIKNGEYSGVATFGNKKVTITSPKVIGKRKIYDTADSPEVELTEERIHRQYNAESTLSARVATESVKFDFPLKTNP